MTVASHRYSAMAYETQRLRCRFRRWSEGKPFHLCILCTSRNHALRRLFLQALLGCRCRPILTLGRPWSSSPSLLHPSSSSSLTLFRFSYSAIDVVCSCTRISSSSCSRLSKERVPALKFSTSSEALLPRIALPPCATLQSRTSLYVAHPSA